MEKQYKSVADYNSLEELIKAIDNGNYNKGAMLELITKLVLLLAKADK